MLQPSIGTKKNKMFQMQLKKPQQTSTMCKIIASHVNDGAHLYVWPEA